MLKIKFASVLLLISLVLIGCQNNGLILSNEVSSIEVYEWSGKDLVATIDNEELIEELVKELNSAKAYSTADMDFAMPDYKLLFISKEEVIYEIGYYKEVMKLGIEGQYWEFDQIYGVKLKLPLD